ncbi:unnamed protein product [Pseudo-nitzschia multistriata]|uniref:Uncharacterized protein n=1 Tax=Pseudo-nitzschia multistriata TaxID=183589 RepID=A0A448ZFE6_9STRA|nr:unnamed protein product [Pseudo-nitzschia multistriata]
MSKSKSKSKLHSSSKKKRKREDEKPLALTSVGIESNDKQEYFDEKGTTTETIADDNNTDKSSKRNKKQNKKRKKRKIEDKEQHCSSLKEKNSTDYDTNGVTNRAENSPPSLQQETATDRAPSSKKKKRKKKKNNKISEQNSPGKNKDEDVEHFDNTNYNDVINDEVVLEGAMISELFVLIDRKGGKVYSATEQRLENGNRQQIGCLDGNGGVVIFQKTEEKDKDLNSSSNTGGHINGNPSTAFPYEVDPDDHCESPLEAYEDIVPLLQSYSRWIRKESINELSIYDPYFCDGRVARQLNSLGFPEVYNRKEDCYEVWKDPSIYPSYDVFLTNPPYSADHIEMLMKHVTSKKNQNKPWMLLMPNFVHKKDYFQKLTSNAGQLPIYLVPRKRYIYLVSLLSN